MNTQEAHEVLDRFFATESLAVAQVGQLCGRFCPTCRETADAGLRRWLCNDNRCGMLDEAKFIQEQIVMQAFLHRLRNAPEAISLDGFNDYIQDAGVITLGLVQDEAGKWLPGWRWQTLRGAIHLAVVTTLTLRDASFPG